MLVDTALMLRFLNVKDYGEKRNDKSKPKCGSSTNVQVSVETSQGGSG
jgi:hypothetical protein